MTKREASMAALLTLAGGLVVAGVDSAWGTAAALITAGVLVGVLAFLVLGDLS